MQHLALLLCLACAPAATRPDAAPAAKAPMVAEWVVQGESAGQLSLIARIHRHTAFSVPVTVMITVPEGLRLVSGRTWFVIPEETPAGTTDEPLVFEVVQPPAKDLVLDADAHGADFGVHARRKYAFARPEPSALAPQEKAKDLEVGGRNFGPSVPAKP